MDDNIIDENFTVNESEIVKFLSGKCIFVTGATGFIGKVLIEKLLHYCRVDHIYILIRAKRGKSFSTRMDEMFESEMFSKLTGDWRSKITPVEGEMGMTDLGIDNTMKEELFKHVEMVFHCAATVRFDETMKRALLINVRGTAEVINLCKRMISLNSVVHVSTAFAHCTRASIEEQFYTPGMDYKKALSLLDKDDEYLNSMESTLLNGWPNTYTFTKAIAEDIVRIEGKHLPIAIFRPAIVTNTYIDSSVPGYIDSTNGPIGLIVGIGFGVVKSVYFPENHPAHIVPVDFCINVMLASAWKIGTQRFDEMPIYNLSIHEDNSMSFAKILRTGIHYGNTVPSIRAMWYNTLLITDKRWLNVFTCFFLHYIPAFLIDIIFRLSGQKAKAMNLCRKSHNLLDKVGYFMETDWKFNCENTQNLYASLNGVDRKLFNFDMKVLNWLTYFSIIIDGIRLFIFKETPSNLEAARKRYFKLKILHYTVVYGFYAIVLYWLFAIMQKFSYPILKSDFKSLNVNIFD